MEEPEIQDTCEARAEENFRKKCHWLFRNKVFLAGNLNEDTYCKSVAVLDILPPQTFCICQRFLTLCDFDAWSSAIWNQKMVRIWQGGGDPKVV